MSTALNRNLLDQRALAVADRQARAAAVLLAEADRTRQEIAGAIHARRSENDASVRDARKRLDAVTASAVEALMVALTKSVEPDPAAKVTAATGQRYQSQDGRHVLTIGERHGPVWATTIESRIKTGRRRSGASFHTDAGLAKWIARHGGRLL
jgi:hypothetical protein